MNLGCVVVEAELVSSSVAEQWLGLCWPWHTSVERSPGPSPPAKASLQAGE